MTSVRTVALLLLVFVAVTAGCGTGGSSAPPAGSAGASLVASPVPTPAVSEPIPTPASSVAPASNGPVPSY